MNGTPPHSLTRTLLSLPFPPPRLLSLPLVFFSSFYFCFWQALLWIPEDKTDVLSWLGALKVGRHKIQVCSLHPSWRIPHLSGKELAFLQAQQWKLGSFRRDFVTQCLSIRGQKWNVIPSPPLPSGGFFSLLPPWLEPQLLTCCEPGRLAKCSIDYLAFLNTQSPSKGDHRLFITDYGIESKS